MQLSNARGQDGAVSTPEARSSLAPVLAMMALYFLVVCSVGILRPIRNALALDGLGQTDFYKVYLVSAVVILFVPLLNRLSDHVPWRRLIPGVALFFAANLLLFRALYVEGSTAFGLVFYGWYDLFAAALVTQCFILAQLFFHARLARNAYPLIIAGGSIGATAGGAITGFLAESVGTPNLLLVAAALIGGFALAIPAVWAMEGTLPARQPGRRKAPAETGKKRLRAIFANRQVLLITGMVLVTVLVKQLVDYQFNTVTKQVFLERDAISAFQGKFNAATQWLPLVFLAGMRRPLRRWGVGFAVLLLPAAMLLTNVGLVLFFGLWTAVAAKGLETGLRYSAERTGREILYVPVPEEIKLKAKAYIDVAVEKGIGKVLSALLIVALLTQMEYRHVAWAGAALSLVWIGLAVVVRREYVRTLARSVEERYASLRGVFASLADASALDAIRDALRADERQVAFALDLIDQAPPEDAGALAPELVDLLEHPAAAVRARALTLLARAPNAVAPEAVRPRLRDPEAEVREAAVRALHATRQEDGAGLLRELLGSEDPAVRTATLTCLARGEVAAEGLDVPGGLEDLSGELDRSSGPVPAGGEARALLAAALRPPDAAEVIGSLLEDPDDAVARTAAWSAGMLGDPRLDAPLVGALGRRGVRAAARDALALQGPRVVPLLAERLLDESADRDVRRQIPSVLARIPAPETVEALVRCVRSRQTDQLLDHRAIKALSKLRARNPDLAFPVAPVEELLARSLRSAAYYAQAGEMLRRMDGAAPAATLLRQAVGEAWAERREEVFRCLGLRHPPQDIYRCYLAVVRGETVPRANALEWLESTVGFRAFRELGPILAKSPEPAARAYQLPGGSSDGSPDPRDVLFRLERDEDGWIAYCSSRAARELGLRPGAPTPPAGAPMNLIETVFLLQRVDILGHARTDHLSLLASIAEEVDAEPGTCLFQRGEPTDALYVVVRGRVVLSGAGGDVERGEGTAFGTWALIDDVPSVAEARVVEPTRLLRIGRADFHDLLADHPELAIGILQGLARRVRTLVAS